MSRRLLAGFAGGEASFGCAQSCISAAPDLVVWFDLGVQVPFGAEYVFSCACVLLWRWVVVLGARGGGVLSLSRVAGCGVLAPALVLRGF